MPFDEFVIFAPSGAIGVPTQARSHGGLHHLRMPSAPAMPDSACRHANATGSSVSRLFRSRCPHPVW